MGDTTQSANAGPRVDRLPTSAWHYKIVMLITAGLFIDAFQLHSGAVCSLHWFKVGGPPSRSTQAMLLSPWPDLSAALGSPASSAIGSVAGFAIRPIWRCSVSPRLLGRSHGAAGLFEVHVVGWNTLKQLVEALKVAPAEVHRRML